MVIHNAIMNDEKHQPLSHDLLRRSFLNMSNASTTGSPKPSDPEVDGPRNGTNYAKLKPDSTQNGKI